MIVATYVKRYVFVVALLLVASPVASAQTVGDCEPGRAERDLDINDVRASLFNGGNLFYGNATIRGYRVPKRTGNWPIFNTEFWVGGLVEGELRVAGATYDRFEFWPGPLDENGNPPADCSDYDRIYVVSRGDVAHYYETGEATDDLRDWPVDLGAPVLDGDGVPGNYNLEGGDEPAISGEQMAWWVMNDAGNVHDFSGTLPIGLEARVEAFAAASSAGEVNQATLYRYRLHYRGAAPLDSVYVALWTEHDVGDAGDDCVGSDTTLHMGFGYNCAESDFYYEIPPAVGVKVVQGPVGLQNGKDDDGDGETDEPGERLGMTASSCYSRVSYGDPHNGERRYSCMRGGWADGTPMTDFGFGYQTEGAITTFIWPGDPVTGEFWSAENYDGSGSRFLGADIRFTVASGPFRMEPGDTEEVVFAIPFAQGADRLDSVVKLREAARYLQRAYDLGVFEPKRVRPAPTEPPPPQVFALRAFPNPFAASASVELTVAEGAGVVRLAVYDVLGREVAVLADGVLAPGVYPFALDGAGLPAGVYFVRLETGRQTEAITLVHVE